MKNQTTLDAYEKGVQAYIEKTTNTVSGIIKEWIDATLSLLPPAAKIMEIGSGHGRDARYMHEKGFTVECSDATSAFVKLLQQQGYSARLFNIVTDSFTTTYDLIFANAVLLHLQPQEFRQALQKIGTALAPQGVFAFSMKHGQGEEWEKEKVGHLRYFCYWQEDALCHCLDRAGFSILAHSRDQKFRQIIARKKS